MMTTDAEQTGFGFIKTKRDGIETITIVDPEGSPSTLSSTHASFKDVLALWKEGKKREAVEAISAATMVKSYTDGTFTVKDNELLVKGRVVPVELADMILDFKSDELDYMPLVRFAEKLLENPSYRSVQQLFSFLTKNKQPITDDGDFIAYKRVADNFLDLHSKTMDNSPGTVVKMERNAVEDNPDITCSKGLHAACWDYACNQYYSGTGVLVSVKINPKNVVSVPVDHDNGKLRVSEYEVLKVITEPLKEKLIITGTNFSKPADTCSKSHCDDRNKDDGFEDDEIEDENECEQCWCDPCECDEEDDDSKDLDSDHFCTKCGQEAMADDKFCHCCGKALI